jgi:hypothetical protein
MAHYSPARGFLYFQEESLFHLARKYKRLLPLRKHAIEIGQQEPIRISLHAGSIATPILADP